MGTTGRILRFLSRWHVLALVAACSAPSAAESAPPGGAPAGPLVIFDGPLWDISDEGLPYRLTFAWPLRASHPLPRLLHTRELRGTLGTGYAVVYDNFDTGTNRITDRGRDGVMLNAGAQAVWPIPLPLPRGALGLECELGLNYASRKFPANGSRMSFSLIAGIEWSSAPGDRREWIAGVRWLHLSHGGFFGPNGGYDGLVFRVGRRWSR